MTVNWSRRSIALLSLASLLALYAIACGTLALLEPHLLYLVDHAQTTPAQAELDHTSEVQIRTEDGETLNAWYLDAGPDTPLALFFHGNGGSLVECADGIDTLHGFGFSVLAIDYRGYGKSTGHPSETGMYRDAEAALGYALAHGHSLAQTVAVGQSLGTGVAVHLAAAHHFAAVLLDSPYTSTADVAAFWFPFFPVHALMHDQFHSDRAIDDIDAPLLIVHGDNDWTVPFRFGQRLYDMAKAPKTFVRVPGGDHLVIGEPEADQPIRDWLKTLPITGLKPREDQ